jgi:hypothetical protein
MPTTIIDPQDQIVELLKKSAVVATVENITAEDRQDIVSKITNDLNKLGLCIVVQTIDEKVTHPNKPGPIYDDVTCSVMVYENVLINRSKTNTTCRQIAKAISGALHHQRLDGGTGKMLLSKGIFYQQDSKVLAYAVDFQIS